MAEHKHSANCKEVFALLSQYLDAELTPETCEDIEKHLSGCPPCIEFLNTLRRTVKLCHCHEATVQPPPMSDRELAELRAAYQKMLASRG
jgi:predicted anti-sigma-YlaC factor YlaD